MAPIEKYTNATFDNDLLFFTNSSIRLCRRCPTNTHRLRTFRLSFRRSIHIGRLSDFALSVCPVWDRTRSSAHLPFRIRMTVFCCLLKRRCENRHIRLNQHNNGRVRYCSNPTLRTYATVPVVFGTCQLPYQATFWQFGRTTDAVRRRCRPFPRPNSRQTNICHLFVRCG
jgi:hypothetical protein